MTTAPATRTFNSQDRLAGLDALRVFALILVTWQHAASVLGFYAETQWHGISPGQTGVAIFCTISGFLAFRSRPENVLEWFKKRLLTVFPAYWIVTIAAFAMVMVAGSEKTITIWLFISQMLGLGFFTHGWELVNVVSWFLSLILLCYFLAALAWSSSYPNLFWSATFGVALVLVATRTEVDLSRHIMAFALGALFSLLKTRTILMAMAFWLFVFGIMNDPQLFYAGCSLLMLMVCIARCQHQNNYIAKIAKYSYEYFLVHGICLAFASKFIENQAVSVVMAIIMAALVATSLQRLVRAFLIVHASFKSTRLLS
jgi:peptidoglycan/LPS O-acetylase OafA/YrhL